jgi:hypothetical protein
MFFPRLLLSLPRRESKRHATIHKPPHLPATYPVNPTTAPRSFLGINQEFRFWKFVFAIRIWFGLSIQRIDKLTANIRLIVIEKCKKKLKTKKSKQKTKKSPRGVLDGRRDASQMSAGSRILSGHHNCMSHSIQPTLTNFSRFRTECVSLLFLL